MEFVEYEKMALTLDPFKDAFSRLSKEEWIVSEKVHGANFSCHTDGEECKFARRRDFLKENEGFYNYKNAEFMNGFCDKAMHIFKRVQEILVDKDIAQVVIYGEIFGGHYDHPDLPKKKTKPIQIEIQYAPNIHLYCFDIAYNCRQDDGSMSPTDFLDFSDAIQLFEETGLFYAKPIFRGSMNGALNFPIGFDSQIPAQLGLPSLPKGTNKAEGVVIRPMKNVLVKTAFGENERVIIKRKVPEFDETRNQKGNKKQRAVVDNSLRPDKTLIPIMLQYVTENRMVSAVTKHGLPETDELKVAIEKEFMDDVISDMTMDEKNNTLWEACSDKQKEVVKKCLKGKTGALLAKYIDKML